MLWQPLTLTVFVHVAMGKVREVILLLPYNRLPCGTEGYLGRP